MIPTRRKKQYSESNKFQCHFLHHKSHRHRTQVSPCEIYGVKSGTGTVVSPECFGVSPVTVIPPLLLTHRHLDYKDRCVNVASRFGTSYVTQSHTHTRTHARTHTLSDVSVAKRFEV